MDMASIKPGGEGMNIGMTLRSAKNLAKIGTQMLASKLVSFKGIKVGTHRNLKVFTPGTSFLSIVSGQYSFQEKIAKIIAYQPHPPLWKLPFPQGKPRYATTTAIQTDGFNQFHRVPTQTGKPGKMGRHFPVREK